ncbi:MAG: hypothetical protein KC493_10840, partial [Bacteriovoracaceae bacterium]|nr:hypothetical protein [Bacteriovoracaceae bacterium]
GSSWTGLYVSNFEIATRNKIVEYKNQWQNDYRQQKIFILKDESLLEYSTDLEVNSFMKSIYPETEFHNDGTVMYFMGKRTYRESQRHWRKMKNNKQQFVGFFTSTDYRSFSNKEELVDKNQLSGGRVLVEIKGQKLQPVFVENSKILTSVIDQPRVCNRHTRWDKAECYEIDRSCHVRTRDEVSPKVFELNPSDFENTTLIKFNGNLGMEISNYEDIKPMKYEPVMKAIGVIGMGHCPSKEKRGFRLIEYPAMTSQRDVRIRYDLQLTYKKPAPFQLWL